MRVYARNVWRLTRSLSPARGGLSKSAKTVRKQKQEVKACMKILRAAFRGNAAPDE